MTERVVRVPFPLHRLRAPDDLLRYGAEILPFPTRVIARSGTVRQDVPGIVERWWSLQFDIFAHCFGATPFDEIETVTRRHHCVEDPESPEAA